MTEQIVMTGRRLCNTSVSDAEISLRGMLHAPERLLATCNAMTDYLNQNKLEQFSRRKLIARYRKGAMRVLNGMEGLL